MCLPERDRSECTHFLSLWSQGIYGQRTPDSLHSPCTARTDLAGEFRGKQTVHGVPTTRRSRSRRRCVPSLGESLSEFRQEHSVGSGGEKQCADSVWLPPGPMWHLCNSSSERHRSNGCRSRADC